MKLLFRIFLALVALDADLFSAEAGMPQLDPKYWASQAFWLVIVFTALYLSISKLFIPKIKNNLDNRDNKIKNDLDDAKNFKDTAENKQNEYEKTIEQAKKEVNKILFENKNKLSIDIQNKKKQFEEEIEIEISKAQREILDLKQGSLNEIEKISEEMTSVIIKDISGDALNESSIKATIKEVSKENLGKYL
tara:strand:- start:88 stop:663 length:576 start_codon:yes stop_codon:yes gene_type:complete